MAATTRVDPPVAFATESALAWSRVVSRSFVPLFADGIGDDPFAGTIRGRTVDGVFFSKLVVTAHEVQRTPSLIAASERLFYKVMLLTEGTGTLYQDGRVATMLPGSVSVYDTSRPYRLSFDDPIDAVVVMIPRDMVDPTPEHMQAITAISFDRSEPLARLVTPFLVEIAEDFAALEGPAATRVVRTSVELISAMLSTAALTHSAPGDSGHLKIMLRIREHIQARLGDPDLGPDSIARAMYISRRHLHDLFRESGTTVSTWIREQRIEAIKRDLANPVHAHRPVSEIAAAWGYLDPSHLSRTFRQLVGVPPSEYRRQATAARPAFEETVSPLG